MAPMTALRPSTQPSARSRKQFGKGSIMRMGEKPARNIESIPTGALALTWALGIGGASKSSTVRPEVVGKSTLAMHVVAEAQRTEACARTSTPTRRTVYGAPLGGTWRLLSASPTGGAGPRDLRMLIPSVLDVIVSIGRGIDARAFEIEGTWVIQWPPGASP